MSATEGRTPLVQAHDYAFASQTTDKAATLYAVFAEPDDRTFLEFKKLVDDLAIENEVETSFIPHLTLWKRPMVTDLVPAILAERVGWALMKWSDGCSEENPAVMRFNVSEIDLKDDTFRVTFEETPAIDFLQRLVTLEMEGQAYPEPPEPPHLSLIHGLHGHPSGSGVVVDFQDVKAKTEVAKCFEDIDGFVCQTLLVAKVRQETPTRQWDIVARFRL